MQETLPTLFYLVASACFILALQGLSSARTSIQGLLFGVAGMILAVGTALLAPDIRSYSLIILAIAIGGGCGWLIALKIEMTALPQLIAAFHSLIGLAAVFVAGVTLVHPELFHLGQTSVIGLIEMGLGAAIGGVTFTGSLVAFSKLQGLVSGKPLIFPGQHPLNAALGGVLLLSLVLFSAGGGPFFLFCFILLLSFILGFLLVLPIGGADMPVVISMLNSYSGWAAAGIGFTLSNTLLIIVGALVGSSGAILSYIMCKGMNRSIINIILGGGGLDVSPVSSSQGVAYRPVKTGHPEDAAFILKNAGSVVIVPGYGMAVAQAQHALREMSGLLKNAGASVRYAIHPVAGRMPGHMNVLLAEAHIPYDDVKELEEINADFPSTDVVFVIGANDVTNPSAKTDSSSPLYGMPILDVARARNILFVKRSLASGYAGVDNPLFYQDNTLMLFGDAKKVCEEIAKLL